MRGNYFSNLNYTLGNEDASLEFQLLLKKTNHVFAVAGSGSRILPLLARSPRYLTCVDTSYPQLYLTELRIETLRLLEWEEFLAFWSYPPKSFSPEEREKVFERIQLSKPASKYLTQIFTENNWESLLYIGKWEKTFNKLSKINRLITGRKALKLFEQKDSETYFSYLRNKFPHKAWAFTVFLLGNATVFNALLYKGRFPRKNIPGKLHKFYLKSLNKLFNQGLARNNFLLQLLFFGRLQFPEGNPIECDKNVFSLAKQGVKNAHISYIQGDFIEEIAKADRHIDFLSFSDIVSYFNGETEKTFLQKIHQSLSLNCLLVLRYYLRVPESMDLVGYEEVTESHGELINQEKTQMYLIKILKKK